jgi:hypothetical protein
MNLDAAIHAPSQDAIDLARKYYNPVIPGLTRNPASALQRLHGAGTDNSS